MATGTDQLFADFEKLRAALESYPDISIVKTSGDPPDEYEIAYSVKGYSRSPDGSVAITSQHQVSFSLPFGYPHFPPTVKPLTDLFHPDIDPDAIRIADFWQDSQSLADLVLHVGEMICGIHFSCADPFNQAAADWYEAHREELPLDRLRMAALSPDDSSSYGALDDDTFAALSLESNEEMPEETEDDDFFQLENENSYEDQIRTIRIKLEEGNVFEASRVLAEIPDDAEVAVREELTTAVTSAIQESNKKHRKATNLEQEGKLAEALRILEELSRETPDHPSVPNSLKRVRDSLAFAESLAQESDKKDEASEAPAKKTQVPAQKKKSPKKKKIQRAQKVRPQISQASGRSFSFLPFLIAAIILSVLGAGGLLYLADGKKLRGANSSLQEARDLAQKQQYEQAEKSIQTGIKQSSGIIFKRVEKGMMLQEFNNMLQQKSFQEGLAGRIEYEGRYIDKKEATILKKLKELTLTAQTLRKEEKKQQALDQYGKALAFAEKHELFDQADQLKINIAALRLETTIGQAREAEAGKNWANAAKTYEEALQIARAMADKSGEKEIAQKLAAATFRHEMDQSKSAFTGAQWQETIDMLERAKRVQESNPEAVSEAEKKELQRLLASSRLYQGLTIAKTQYEQGNLSRAIADYENVLTLFKDNAAIFGGQAAIQPSLVKIEKTVLSIRVSQLQQKAVVAEQFEEMKKAELHYRTVADLISSSPFAKDEDLKPVAAAASKRATAINRQLLLDGYADYLKENFEELFRKYYPSTGGSTLKDPEVTFLEEKKGKFFFMITCVERSQGSSFLLELNYQYDPKSDKWTMVPAQ